VIIKGADETEFFVGGLLSLPTISRIAALTRVTNSGVISWHCGFTTTANYYYYTNLAYKSISGTNYLFGVSVYNKNYNPVLFIKATLDPTPTNIPISNMVYSF
jgi:hypothetical protein